MLVVMITFLVISFVRLIFVAIPLWLIYLTWKYGIYAMVVVIVRHD